MKRTYTTLWSITAAILAMAVIAGPVAARPILPDSPTNPTSTTEQPAPQIKTVVKESGGFDLGSALVGALAAFGVVSVSLVTVSAARRHHRVAVQ
jgi:hypothetical protein